MSANSSLPSKSAIQRGPRGQRGVALVVGMIFLVMLSLTALVSMNRTILQERMAGAYRSEQMAYAAAEAGLRGAEWRLWIYPVNSNLAYPAITTDSNVNDCRDVCASDATYTHTLTTRATSFRSVDPTSAYAMVNGGGIAKNDEFLAGPSGGSGSALPPLTLTEYIAKGVPAESFQTTSVSGLRGELVVYRISSRGFGPTQDIERQLQSTFTLLR